MKKYRVLAALLLAICGLVAFSRTEAAPQTVGLPNPIVTYDTYAEAKAAVGFEPLYLPPMAGFELYYISTIGGDLADLSFRKIGGQGELRVRTREAKEGSKEDISGIYGVAWQKRPMCGIDVSVTKVGDGAFAAHWKTGNFLFSVQSEGISYPDFLRILENGLVDMACHYYI